MSPLRNADYQLYSPLELSASATCQCPKVPALCSSMPPASATYQCPSELPFSATHQCQSVPPINASQCAYQCASVQPISALQC
ncbi:unnamed protein product, partial [Staurois parvus]